MKKKLTALLLAGVLTVSASVMAFGQTDDGGYIGFAPMSSGVGQDADGGGSTVRPTTPPPTQPPKNQGLPTTSCTCPTSNGAGCWPGGSFWCSALGVWGGACRC